MKIGYRVEGIGDRVWVTLKVYGILGREVATLVNERKNAGSYEVRFDARLPACLPDRQAGRAQDSQAGCSCTVIQAGDFVSAMKMIVVK